jgi:RNA polymerase sigma factor for flagellar operon FliA
MKLSQEKLSKIWDRYKEGDERATNDLVNAYSDTVQAIARSIANQLPKHVEIDDLISDGYIGLMDAIRKFDDSFGYKFETYASFRVRGEILDRLRSADWAPRGLRAKSKLIENAISALNSELNRNPSQEEIAKFLDWHIDEVYSVSGEIVGATFSNLDDIVNMNGSKFSLSDIIPNNDVSIYVEDFDKIKDKLIEAFSMMDHEPSTVLGLYYSEDLSLKEIGDLMGVTESRTCQIHTTALSFLWDHCLTN